MQKSNLLQVIIHWQLVKLFAFRTQQLICFNFRNGKIMSGTTPSPISYNVIRYKCNVCVLHFECSMATVVSYQFFGSMLVCVCVPMQATWFRQIELSHHSLVYLARIDAVDMHCNRYSYRSEKSHNSVKVTIGHLTKHPPHRCSFNQSIIYRWDFPAAFLVQLIRILVLETINRIWKMARQCILKQALLDFHYPI